MTKQKSTPSPKIFIDLVSMCFKIMFALVLIINIVWAIIYFKPQGSRVQINQSGANDVVHQASTD